MSAAALRRVEREVPACTRCPRLVAYLEQIRKVYPDYWCRPVPGFGDPRAWLVIVGLAPGLHGANRSGRPFYMDASGEWLYSALKALELWDGHKLRGAYILNAVKCVPPGNRPNAAELDACRPWLAQELALLSHARVVLSLGSIAHQSVLKTWGARPLSHYPFAHGALYQIESRPPLLVSYHPSRQNTNTGVLRRAMWRAIFQRARRLAKGSTTRPRSSSESATPSRLGSRTRHGHARPRHR